MAKHRPQEIRSAILRKIFWQPESPVTALATEFQVTRQAVHEHLQSLVSEGLIRVKGKGPHRSYSLVRTAGRRGKFPIRPGVTEEDRIWADIPPKVLADLTPEEDALANFGFTEMVNNAIDHSEGTHVTVEAYRTAVSLSFSVVDDGIGIFHKIAAALKLPDPRLSILELAKGKFTTDPARHTGEGVFFASRMFDRFIIRSEQLFYANSEAGDEWVVEGRGPQNAGTAVEMALLLPAGRTMAEVYEQYSSGPTDYEFAKTRVPLRLAKWGEESLISRSQAKRVLARVDRFKEVILDFADVRTVGQGFADEIFRVFARAHPEVHLSFANANEQVALMINRATAAAKAED
jgi:anti-sigma regulatory factor (Ser/Thr protein kinase)